MLAKRVQELHDLEALHQATIRDLQRQLSELQAKQEKDLQGVRVRATQRSSQLVANNEVALQKQSATWDRLQKDIATLQTETASLRSEREAVLAAHQKKRGQKEEYYAKTLSAARGTWVRQEKTKREAWMGTELMNIQKNARKAAEPEIAMLLHQQREELARRRESHEVDLAEMFCDRLRTLEEDGRALRRRHEEDLDAEVSRVQAETRRKMEETSKRLLEVGVSNAAEAFNVQRGVREEHWQRQRAAVHEDTQLTLSERRATDKELEQLRTLADRENVSDGGQDDVAARLSLEREMERWFETQREALRADSQQALRAQRESLEGEAAKERTSRLRGLVAQFEADGLDVVRRLQNERRHHDATLRSARCEVSQLRDAIAAKSSADQEHENVATQLRNEIDRVLRPRLEEARAVHQRRIADVKAAHVQHMRDLMGSLQHREREAAEAFERHRASLGLAEARCQYRCEVEEPEVAELERAHEARMCEMKDGLAARAARIAATIDAAAAERTQWEQRLGAATTELQALEGL
eukprot:PhM_4_TR14671/c0_g1_i1/m.87685